ncbi:hypothetical protein HMN09_01052300 [Mycena chlorophos]|uniref:Uncharacterized protein n=1 Tax=Mycena chlorophos TaxID=658473 RepID=A0A8H6SBN5_MYCCL|nr:hypothetical protein HMN09_01052300 [Mycena chlorophos]
MRTRLIFCTSSRPHTPYLKIDRDPCPHGGPLPTTTLCSPTYLSMGDDHMEFTWPSNVYLQALSRFDLNNLEHLVVNAPWLTFPPFPEEYPTHVFSSKLPRLRTLFAPLKWFLHSCAAVACSQASLYRGIPYTERALRLVNDLQRFCPLLTTLAFTLVLWDKSVVWDNSVVRSISERLPHLEALEILYHQYDPACTSPRKPSPHSASDLSKFSNLHTLHIHPFPQVAFEGFFLPPPRQTPASGYGDAFASTPCARRVAVEALAGSSRALKRVRLAYDHDASQTWVRVDGEWKLIEERHMDIEWSSASILSEDLRYVT